MNRTNAWIETHDLRGEPPQTASAYEALRRGKNVRLCQHGTSAIIVPTEACRFQVSNWGLPHPRDRHQIATTINKAIDIAIGLMDMERKLRTFAKTA